MMRRLILLLAFIAAPLGSTARSEAILSITDAEITPDGRAVVDLLIAGDGLTSLDSFGVVLRLSTDSGRRLEFLAPGPGSATDGQLDDPGYLFAGDSIAQNFPPAGLVLSEPNPNDTYVGGDGTESGSGISIPTTPTLLTRLELTATADPPLYRDHFEVSLDLADPRTFFLDANLDPVDVRVTGVGVVTVIPEPTSLGLLAIGLAAGLILAVQPPGRSGFHEGPPRGPSTAGGCILDHRDSPPAEAFGPPY